MKCEFCQQSVLWLRDKKAKRLSVPLCVISLYFFRRRNGGNFA
uniref:Uncharacterized protein n=1 Tax=Anguilla anguilla TaxID=7936 RepID=A0A0E9V0F5_ANGAN